MSSEWSQANAASSTKISHCYAASATASQGYTDIACDCECEWRALTMITCACDCVSVHGYCITFKMWSGSIVIGIIFLHFLFYWFVHWYPFSSYHYTRIHSAVHQCDVPCESCSDAVAAEGRQLNPTQHLLRRSKIPDFDGASKQCQLPAVKSWFRGSDPNENQRKVVFLPDGQAREVSQYRTVRLYYWSKQSTEVRWSSDTDQSATPVYVIVNQSRYFGVMQGHQSWRT